MIDLTMKLDKDHQIWKWLETEESKLLKAGHIGTHIDVYKKSRVPINYFKTKGIFIDCSSYKQDHEIGLETIRNIDINENEQVFIIFRTNIQTMYPYGDEIYINEHYQLSWELIDYLLDKKVCFIGIDCAGIRRGKEHYKADVKAEEKSTYIIENLDLSQLKLNEGKTFDVYTMWIDNPFATGLSTRVLVDIDG